MFEQNQDPNEEQINEEQISQSNEGQAGEEQSSELDENQLNQPVESSDDFSEQESLELPDSAPSSKKKKLIIIIAVVLGVILVSGGLLFAADRFWGIEIPFLSKLFKTETSENVAVQPVSEEMPEEVIGKMFSSFKDIKTSHETFDLKITEDNKDGEDKITNILLEGKRDLNMAGNPKLDYAFTFIQPNSKTGLSLAFKYIDKTTYIKLAEGSETPLFDLSQLQNQWFYFGKQEGENLKGVVDGGGQAQSESNKEGQEKISDILKEAKLFKSIKSLQGDAIDSVPVFHYLVALDAQGFSEFMTKLEDISQNKLKGQNSPVEFPKEKIDEMKKQLEKTEDMPIEIWIEKGTYFLRKVLINHFEADVSKPEGSSKADVLLTFELNNINEPVNIQAPEDGQSLAPVMQNLFEKWFSQMPLQNGGNESGAMGNLDDDKDGLTNQEELFYNTDPKNPDTDGDGFSDGNEVKNGYNPNGSGKL